jgi:F420-dependent oxidoreductase-like protein
MADGRDPAPTPPSLPIRLGLQIPIFRFGGAPAERLFERVAATARAAEGSGFDSVWVHDHLHQSPWSGPEDDPMLEAYTLLGALAAVTERVWIGAMVSPVTTRHPGLLARMVTSLDVISGGRAVLGIGAGNHPEEHRAYGIPFASPSERIEMVEEAVQVCRAMFTNRGTTFEGRHFRLEGALNVPQPVRPGGPPILIGGGGERRMLRVVARHADLCGFFGDAATIRRKLDILERYCQEVGRDPADITKTRLSALVIADTRAEAEEIGARMREARRMGEEVYREAIVGTPDQVLDQARTYLDAGLDGLIFNMHDPENLDHVRLAGEVLSKLFR